MSGNKIHYPKLLNIYSNKDYSTQQKAQFVYYLIIAAIIGIVFLTLSSIFIQLRSQYYEGIYLPIIIPMALSTVLFLTCFVLLIKGRFSFASHLMVLLSSILIWYTIWTDVGDIIARLDTLVLIIALLNFIPLLTVKYKYTMLFYSFANLITLIIFVYTSKERFSISDAAAIDLIIDTSIAIAFSGIVGYHIFRINERSLEKDEFDNRERKEAEKALEQSEFIRRKVFENSDIPIVVMNTDSYEFTDINPAAIKIYGFVSLDASLGKTPLDVSGPYQYDGILSSQKAKFYIDKALIDGSVTFEWLHCRPNGEFWDAEVHLLSIQSENNKYLQFSLVDITERKKAEKQLKENEEKYRTLFENAQIGIYQTTPEGNILQSNPALVRMLGFDSLEELSKRNTNDEDAYVNSSRESFVNLIEKQGYVTDFESEWKKKDSDSILVKINTRAVRDNNGKTIFYEGFVENITERKLAEKALTESEEKYRTLMENMNEVVMMIDGEDRIQYVNKNFTDKLGYLPDEVIGEVGFKLLFDKSDLDVINNASEKRSRSIVDPYELSFASNKGKKISFLVSASPMINSDGKALGFILAMADITDRKITEQLLKESEQKYRTLMESMNEVIMMVDNDDKVQYVNKKFTEILGYTEEDIIGEIGYKKLLDPNNHDKIIKANQERTKNIISQYETSFIAKYGTKVDFLISGAPIKDSNGKVIGSIGSMIDITEKKKIEQELAKYRQHLEFLVKERTEELATSNEELLSTNEELHNQREELEVVLLNLQKTQKQLIQSEKMASLGVLASGIAHEINNPLNFIQGGIFGIEQYLEENLSNHSEELAPLINGINTGIIRAANIVTSLNHYSRKNDLKKEECDMHSIIENCLVILRNQTVNRIEIEKNYTTESHKLIGNEGKLHQALLNILSNAVHAIKNKGVISVNTRAVESNLVVTITDTGSGIANENLPKIMDPFFTTKEPGKGTGLGLSITYNILEEHRGSLDFKSSVGKGTRVTIKLPLES